MGTITRLKAVLLMLALAPALAACGETSASTAKNPTARAAAPAPRAVATPAPPPPPKICLVTREQGVPDTYVPADLVALPRDYTLGSNIRMRQEAAQAAVKLIDAAWEEGHKLLAESGYRSYQEQQGLVAEVARRVGLAQAQRQVAPPGHSEHQLGLAVDMGIVRKPFSDDPSFGDEPEGRWLAANGPTFGFVISYPRGKEAVTGYSYEPWHVRYVGPTLAQQIHASGQTITEFVQANQIDGGC